MDRARNFVKYVYESRGRKKEWAELCDSLDLDMNNLQPDVSTRWNSTHDMLKKLVPKKAAVQEYLERLEASGEDITGI